MLMLRKMPVTFGLTVRTVLICAVTLMELYSMVHPALGSSGESI